MSTPVYTTPRPGSGGGGGDAAWGSITGTLSAQSDLQNELDALDAADLTEVAIIVSGDVTVSNVESFLALGIPAGLLVALGYSCLSSKLGGAVSGPHAGGTVTGGSGDGLYEWDGANLNFARALVDGEQLAVSGQVIDDSGTLVAYIGTTGQVQELNLGGGPELVIATSALGAESVIVDASDANPFTPGLSAADDLQEWVGLVGPYFGPTIFCAVQLHGPLIDLDAAYFGMGGIISALAYLPGGTNILVTGQFDSADDGVYVVPDDWFGGGGTTAATRPVDYASQTWSGLMILAATKNFAAPAVPVRPLTADGINYVLGPVLPDGYTMPLASVWYTNLNIGSYTPVSVTNLPVYLTNQTDPNENGWYVEAYDGTLVADPGTTIAMTLALGEGWWESLTDGVANDPVPLKRRYLVDGSVIQVYPQTTDLSGYATETYADTVADNSRLVPVSGQSGSAYTIQSGDDFKCVEINHSSANTVYVPDDATTNFDVGTIIEVMQAGGGTTTIEPLNGNVTIRNVGDIAAQYQTVSLRKRAANDWVLSGAVA